MLELGFLLSAVAVLIAAAALCALTQHGLWKNYARQHRDWSDRAIFYQGQCSSLLEKMRSMPLEKHPLGPVLFLSLQQWENSAEHAQRMARQCRDRLPPRWAEWYLQKVA